MNLDLSIEGIEQRDQVDAFLSLNAPFTKYNNTLLISI